MTEAFCARVCKRAFVLSKWIVIALDNRTESWLDMKLKLSIDEDDDIYFIFYILLDLRKRVDCDKWIPQAK